MNPITEIKNRLIAYKAGVILTLIERIIAENLEFIEDLQTDQLEQGLDGDGNQITPRYRSDTYARVKQFMNSKPPFGVPDLKLTGSFHRKIDARISGQKVIITSSDQKTADLLAKYGEAILYLNEQSLDRLKEELLLPELIIETEKYLLS